LSKSDGVNTAIELAIRKLRGADLGSRWSNLGLPRPDDGRVDLRLFGIDARLDISDWTLVDTASGEPVRPADRLLLLHYLECDLPVTPTGELVSFRSLSGGQFYYTPFRGRTVAPLLKSIGNDLERLTSHLGRFDHEQTRVGDLGVRIHAFGNIWVTLVYHLGDEEFPASADVLFDPCIKRVFGAEDAAVIAGRICVGLL
jgi:hypothetical protein